MQIIDFTYRKPRFLKSLEIPPHKIDTIGLHHTGNDNDIKTNTDYHIDSNKWAWLGYGWYIEGGKIYRVRGAKHQNAGIRGHNHHTVNIAVQGNYNADHLSLEDREALEWLIGYLKKENDNIKYLKGHNFFSKTTCPGRNFDVNYFTKFLEVEKENVELEKLKQELINETIRNDSLENEINDLKNRNVKLKKENKLLLKLYKKYRLRYKELYVMYQDNVKELRANIVT